MQRQYCQHKVHCPWVWICSLECTLPSFLAHISFMAISSFDKTMLLESWYLKILARRLFNQLFSNIIACRGISFVAQNKGIVLPQSARNMSVTSCRSCVCDACRRDHSCSFFGLLYTRKNYRFGDWLNFLSLPLMLTIISCHCLVSSRSYRQYLSPGHDWVDPVFRIVLGVTVLMDGIRVQADGIKIPFHSTQEGRCWTSRISYLRVNTIRL